jgi:predicted DNA-binding transcriptional regulator AlpA
MEMVEKRYLTLKEISEHPGISVKGIYNMVNRRELSKILNKIKK